jgi:hypothetical protein
LVHAQAASIIVLEPPPAAGMPPHLEGAALGTTAAQTAVALTAACPAAPLPALTPFAPGHAAGGGAGSSEQALGAMRQIVFEAPQQQQQVQGACLQLILSCASGEPCPAMQTFCACCEGMLVLHLGEQRVMDKSHPQRVMERDPAVVMQLKLFLNAVPDL